MPELRSPNPPIASPAREKAGVPSRPNRPRRASRRRHLEAHAVAWLRALPGKRRVHS
jgi:hypothetical protein